MKLHYYPETDSLYIELQGRPGAETREIAHPSGSPSMYSCAAALPREISMRTSLSIR